MSLRRSLNWSFKGVACGLSSGVCCSLSPVSSALTAFGKSPRDPSGITSQDGSNLMSSGFGEVIVKCPPIVVCCLGASSPGSFLNHSLHFNACASSNATKLGVIPEVGSQIEKDLVCCNK